MQLYALDDQERVVFVERAQRQRDYICVECRRAVRVRGGSHRKTHFYHLDTTHHCYLSGKGMEHLQAQLYIKAQFPQDDCQLELRFPAINRIADVAWLPGKVVFEIQCAPISAKEVEARNLDYRSVGWEIVWIFHDSRYNQWKISAAELALRQQAVYFTNIDADGRGMVYDQFDLFYQGKRIGVLGPLPIDVKGIASPTSNVDFASFPKVVGARLQERPHFFSGDLVSLTIGVGGEKHEEYLQKVQQWELWHEDQTKTKPVQNVDRLRRAMQSYLIRPYKLLFQLLLERACR